MDKKMLYTRLETAWMLSISPDMLDELRRDGVLQGYHVARGNPRVYFKAADIEKYTERLEVAEC